MSLALKIPEVYSLSLRKSLQLGYSWAVQCKGFEYVRNEQLMRVVLLLVSLIFHTRLGVHVHEEYMSSPQYDADAGRFEHPRGYHNDKGFQSRGAGR